MERGRAPTGRGQEAEEMAEAIEKAKEVLGEGSEYERSGVVSKGATEIMKNNIAAGWVRKACFDACGFEWAQLMAKILAA